MPFVAWCGAVGSAVFGVLALVVRATKRGTDEAGPLDTRPSPYIDPSKLPERIAAMQRAHVSRYHHASAPPKTTPTVRVLTERQWANRAALYDWEDHDTA